MKTLSLLNYLSCLACAIGCLSTCAPAQSRGGQELALSYNASKSNIVGGAGFAMQGGSLQMQERFSPAFGVVADLSDLSTGATPNANVGLNLFTAAVGPRYTWSSPRYRVSGFGQVLGGKAWGLNGIFPSGSGVVSHSSSSALLIGGGVNIPFSRRLSVRALQVDWVRTALPNATTNVQNNVRIGVGFTIRCGSGGIQ